MGSKKTLTVEQLKRILDDLPGTIQLDDLPIVIAGGGQKVVGVEVVYQAELFDSYEDYTGGGFMPIAVMLQVVAA